MQSPIDRLEREIWAGCVRQRLAGDKETLDRWQSDEVAHITERFIVDPVPSSLRPLVDEAIVEWVQIESAFLSLIEMDRGSFLKGFESARDAYLHRTRHWEPFASKVGAVARGVVRNMDWVNLFAWVLPQADREHGAHHAATAKMIAAVFYMEQLAKYGKHLDVVPEGLFARLEARWQLANLSVAGYCA